LNKYTFIIGAHKTGTTFINKLLLHNKSTLEDNKIWFEASGTVKDKLTKHLYKDIGDYKARKVYKSLCLDHKLFERGIYSHENISGTIPSFVENKAFYPKIGERVRRLARIMRDEPVDIFLFIRKYDDHIMSCYSEYMRAKGYIPFQRFHRMAFSTSPSWPKLIQEIKDNYPTATIKVADNSDIAQRPLEVLSSILGEKAASLNLEIPETIYSRPAISESGLKVITLMHRFGYKNIDPKFIDRLAKVLPKSEQYGKLDELNDELKAEYKELYLEHIKILNKDLVKF